MGSEDIKRMIAQSIMLAIKTAQEGDDRIMTDVKKLFISVDQDYDKLENQVCILIQALYRDLEELQRRVKKLEEK